MDSLKAGKRAAAGLVALALAAAPVALASSGSASHATVHAQMQKSGVVLVTGYDGGAALAPGR